MRIILEPTAESREALDGVFYRIEGALKMLAEEAVPLAWSAYAGAIQEIFAQEGPGWENLAARTQTERFGLGYSPAHPILVREGYLLHSLTDLEFGPQTVYEPHISGAGELFAEPIATGLDWEIVQSGGDVFFQAGTMDERFIALQEGTSNMPGRPMLPEGVLEQQVIDEIDRRLVALIEGALGE